MSKTTTHVSFVCQKCAQPIKLNRSLLAKALVDVAADVESKLGLEWSVEEDQETREPSDESTPQLTEPEVEEEQRRQVTGKDGSESVDINDGNPAPILRPNSPSIQSRPRKHRSSLETVSVIYDSLPSQAPRQHSRNTLKHIQIASETFKMLSLHTDVDHPLCVECPEAVLDSYHQEICRMEEAKKHYESMAVRLQKEVKGYKSEMEGVDMELETLQKEEEELKSKLLRTEEQRREIATELAKQKEKEKLLKQEEEAYWREFNDHQRQILQFKDDQISVHYQLQYTTEQLTRLKKTNVLNSAFHIWHNGHFGTINGLRLGRLQTVPVEWSEINAAWGQTTFLLNTLARVARIKFERFKLVPYGNQSFIEDLESKRRILPLHSASGLRLFNDSKFDSAMVAFLDCLNQLKQHIESNSQPHFMLPYKIEKDRIGDGKEFYSIKTQFNTPERWTRALKFVLTNLRWALTWVAASSIQPLSE